MNPGRRTEGPRHQVPPRSAAVRLADVPAQRTGDRDRRLPRRRHRRLPDSRARTLEILESWFERIVAELAQAEREHPGRIAPWAANLIAHRSNPRVADELALIVKYRALIVIVAWAKPGPIVDAIHDYGGLVFSDVNSIEHARKAAAAGVDGLVLVTAGAGGHTGDISPFAFVPAVREFFDGPLVVGGGIVDGRGIRAVEVLGADFANLGTRFIATRECLASDAYKQMLIDSETRDVVATPYFTGVRANYLMPSILRAGIDPEELRKPAPKIDLQAGGGAKAWKDIWSAGHGVFATKDVQGVAELVQQLAAEYQRAAAASGGVSSGA
ncbi:MAG: nitronate monooxygenase [Steroidobacteraceae bacterium]